MATVKELREQAESLGIEGAASMKKADLQAAISAYVDQSMAGMAAPSEGVAPAGDGNWQVMAADGELLGVFASQEEAEALWREGKSRTVIGPPSED